MSKDFEILAESELDTLYNSSDDDVCMASVRCVVRELRDLRAQLAAVMPVVVAAERLVAANKLHEVGGTNPLKRATDSAMLGKALTSAVDTLSASKAGR